MTDARNRIETLLGLRLPAGMVEDAATLAETAAASAHAAAATVQEPRDPGGFLQLLESLAGDAPEGNAGG